jgi:hypothetical protein
VMQTIWSAGLASSGFTTSWRTRIARCLALWRRVSCMVFLSASGLQPWGVLQSRRGLQPQHGSQPQHGTQPCGGSPLSDIGYVTATQRYQQGDSKCMVIVLYFLCCMHAVSSYVYLQALLSDLQESFGPISKS